MTRKFGGSSNCLEPVLARDILPTRQGQGQLRAYVGRRGLARRRNVHGVLVNRPFLDLVAGQIGDQAQDRTRFGHVGVHARPKNNPSATNRGFPLARSTTSRKTGLSVFPLRYRTQSDMVSCRCRSLMVASIVLSSAWRRTLGCTS
jgi:hypothetical protein